MTARYVCVQCGAYGLPDEYTKMDARYATGMCTGTHKGVQYLVLDGAPITEKKKRGKRCQSRPPA